MTGYKEYILMRKFTMYAAAMTQTLTTPLTSADLIKPVVHDGIEFYLSHDNIEAGVSIAGLARLCGIDFKTLRTVLSNLSSAAVGYNAVPKALHELKGKDLFVQMNAFRSAKIIDAKCAATIVNYYAYRSASGNPVARHSAEQFATIGMKKWIQSFLSNPSPVPILAPNIVTQEAFQELFNIVNELKAQVSDSVGYKLASQEMPGLLQWMESVADDQYAHVSHRQLKLIGSQDNDDDFFTINEWLDWYTNGKSEEVSKSLKTSLALMVSASYRSATLESPDRVKPTAEKGANKSKINGYSRKYFGLIKSCYEAITGTGTTM